MQNLFQLTAVVPLLVLVACSSDGGTVDAGRGGDGSGKLEDMSSEPEPVGSSETNASCLTGVPCVDDDDCTAGSGCNKELDPPECTTFYCAPAGSPCSDGALCEKGTGCFDSACRACPDCSSLGGPKCADVSKDVNHCGACDIACRASLLQTTPAYLETEKATCSEGYCMKVFMVGSLPMSCKAFCESLPPVAGQAGWTCHDGLGAHLGNSAVYCEHNAIVVTETLDCSATPSASSGRDLVLCRQECLCLAH